MTRNLRTYLIVGLFALQAVAVLAIVLLTDAAMHPVLIKQMDRQMNASASTATTNAEGTLQYAAASAQLTQRGLEEGLVEPASTSDVETFLLTEIDASEFINAAYFTTTDGVFTIVQTDDTVSPGGYRTKIIETVSGERQVRVIYRDKDHRLVKELIDDTDDYDPLTRPWYTQAVTTDGAVPIWTEPYVFYTSQKPGITASLPVFESDDEDADVAGVVGVDLELTNLSTDLANEIEVTEHGSVVVADRNGGLIATRDPNSIIKKDGDSYRRAKIDEINDPAVAAAYTAAASALTAAAPGADVTVTYDLNGEPYRAVFNPIAEHNDWYVVMVAPESDFVGEIQRAQRFNAVLAVGVGLAIVVLALPALHYVARRGERLHERATTDALTGLANRRHFEEVLAKQLERAKDRNRPLSVAMLDLDHFKGINDTYGHGIGDQALIAVAQHLTAAVRDEDLVARLGGDEYAVLLVGETLDRAEAVLERARLAIEAAPVPSSEGPVQVRITAGVADLIPGVEDNEAFLRRADQALYVAKERGRNQVATIRDVDPSVAGITVPSAPVTTPSAPVADDQPEPIR